MVRVDKPFTPVQPIGAMVKDSLAVIGRATKSLRRPGAVLVQSGIASRGSLVRRNSDPTFGTGGFYHIPAPPAGEVLWFTFEFYSQWWSWDAPGPKNNSSYYKHADFALTWRWHLMTKPTFPPSGGHAIFMWDQNRYEFYASAPPGSGTYTAWWVTPYRGVTLTPYGKESDPNPLALLLGTERDGFLHVWYTFDYPEGTFMGKDISWWVGSRVNEPALTEPILYYSRAVLVPQAPDVEPVVNVKDPQIAGREPAGRSKREAEAEAAYDAIFASG